ncbi:uncharacterized protein LOC110462551 [Mizuhopecten yessoensis]|uniref:Uncharacterized protein n=1 Tax=Mizuhopecten yessoensis TaxID=6573 RepID=A0A210PY37_MIZYE|nr:uncharacterized protein LOC110462551 [Mizuhopecten yessoensis]OWF41397.1 hypothetical protein KP79_PYT08418 [Mizuhopecten yessoensis]
MAHRYDQDDKPKGSTTYFHHTSVERAEAIMQDGVIRQSTGGGGDAVYGNGTYLTRLGPKRSAGEIARNNWDGLSGNHWEYMEGSGRTDAAIAIEMPAHEAGKVERLPERRDIHLYPGDLKLYNKNHRVYIRDQNGKAREYTREYQ